MSVAQGTPTAPAAIISARPVANQEWPELDIRPDSDPAPLLDRFWAKVDKSAGPDACWLWIGARNSASYGLIWVGDRMVRAHRVAWELTNGPIPPDKPVVRHVVCRNPECCNPAHLEPGTHADNMDDMVMDGTSPRGEQNGRAKLTAAKALDVRRVYTDGGRSQRHADLYLRPAPPIPGRRQHLNRRGAGHGLRDRAARTHRAHHGRALASGDRWIFVHPTLPVDC